ncbi:hypothetical protein [Sinorhizobium medicae]|nr:hypothetical protein [Sinorhizobium medicae]
MRRSRTLDVDASDAENARQLAVTRRGVPAGAIRKIKIIREKVDG